MGHPPLEVTDAIAIFRQDGREPQIVSLNARRYKVVGSFRKTKVQRDPLVWSDLAFIMAPTGAASFSVYSRIVEGECCTVDVAVTGYQKKTPFKSQWRASATYLPGAQTKAAS